MSEPNTLHFASVSAEDDRRQVVPRRLRSGRRSGLTGAGLGALMVLALAGGGGLQGEEASVAAVADTFINSGSPSSNAGGHAWFSAGRDGVGGVRRGLFQFDVSEIPPGSVVTSAVVRLTVRMVPATGSANSTFDLHRLTAGWGEGVKQGNNGAPATAGEATWTARRQGTDLWTEPGAKGDAAGAASASAAVGSAAGQVVTWEGPGLVEDVQLWVNDPGQNFGWLLSSQMEGTSRTARGFASREGGSGAPTLEVGYSAAAAPDPVTLSHVSAVENGRIGLEWTGGTGPFIVQRKGSVDEQLWGDDTVVSGREGEVTATGRSGFFQIQDAAGAPAIPLSAALSGAAERPTPVEGEGAGLGLFRLAGNHLQFSVSYQGLGGSATAAHIHGPAGPEATAGVLINLEPFNGPGFGTQGTLSGTVELTDEQRALILSGRTYVNIHTAANPGGEIRGQIVPVLMQVELNGANERPDPVATAGRGLGLLTLVGNELALNVSYAGLSGTASAAHIHGPAGVEESAGVLVNLAPLADGGFSSSGSFSGQVTLTSGQLGQVIAGLTYINIHTAANPGGEIRGQIVPKPAATPLTVWLTGEAERPEPVTTSGTGSGTLLLEGDRLAFTVRYAGLGGPATAAHIHGPATTAEAAGVLINLAPFHQGPFDTGGVFSGITTVTEEQRQWLLDGQTYVNVHTAAHSGGEIRGQIAPALMISELSGANERPTPNDSTATGLGILVLAGRTLHFEVAYDDLTGTATGAHIHGPAATSGTAPVLINFAPFNGGAFGVAGFISGAVQLTPDQLGFVINEQTYINIHTPTHGGGEIRGQIVR